MTANFFEFQTQLDRARRAAGSLESAGRPPVGQSITVSELTRQITRVLGSGLAPHYQVRGEVSNLSRNRSSGHLYFTLKDSEACVDCVMFRSEAARLKFEPQDGLEILAGGRVGVYPQRGRYQLYLSTLRPLGQGALELAFQQLRARLEAEGLFDAGRKKPIPPYPSRIVLITSRGAAALQDALKVLSRFGGLRLMLYAVPVQGEGAAQKIADAIAHVNAAIHHVGGADVILLTRGGGSLEDLWSFNEEVVARAIWASALPIVTGIGHEVDVTIADLAADHHAHTPTEAAQVITALWRSAEERVRTSADRITRGMRTRLSECTQRLRAIERHETFRRPMARVNELRQLLDDRQRALDSAQIHRIRAAHDRHLAARLRFERLLPVFVRDRRETLDRQRQELNLSLLRRLRACQDRLNAATARLGELHPRLRLKLAEQRLSNLRQRLGDRLANDLQRKRLQVDAAQRQLEAVSPRSVLSRGYTITVRKKDGAVLKSAAHLKPGEKLLTRFADGEVQSTVEDSRQLTLFE